jgi:hypothetical protein
MSGECLETFKPEKKFIALLYLLYYLSLCPHSLSFLSSPPEPLVLLEKIISPTHVLKHAVD